jgi:hypothetical protein
MILARVGDTSTREGIDGSSPAYLFEAGVSGELDPGFSADVGQLPRRGETGTCQIPPT